ncbi:MAG TPA: hypothetical protein VE127_00655, partial [Solirubrobacteraceae bacterium]|nr:hypothetical protein [Solirubrobacteraceae bacterium]
MDGARVVWGLTVVGGVALALATLEAVLVGIVLVQGAFWVPAVAALFTAGVLTAHRLPHALAARRLLFLGVTATMWSAAGCGLILGRRHLGTGPWMVVPDTLLVALDLVMPAAILALFAVYADGRYQRGYERRLVRAAYATALGLPLVLLVVRPTLQPTAAFGWLVPCNGKPAAVVSPLHVGALTFLAAPLSLCARIAPGAFVALAAMALALRYRRFDADERLRVRWPLAALLLFALQAAGSGLVAADVLPRAAINAPVIVTVIVLAAA